MFTGRSRDDMGRASENSVLTAKTHGTVHGTGFSKTWDGTGQPWKGARRPVFVLGRVGKRPSANTAHVRSAGKADASNVGGANVGGSATSAPPSARNATPSAPLPCPIYARRGIAEISNAFAPQIGKAFSIEQLPPHSRRKAKCLQIFVLSDCQLRTLALCELEAPSDA
jgi:hypothetical protein